MVYLKSKVFTNKQRTLLESKENIRRQITAIDMNILQRVMDSMHKRIADCIENGMDRLCNVIFKTENFVYNN